MMDRDINSPQHRREIKKIELEKLELLMHQQELSFANEQIDTLRSHYEKLFQEAPVAYYILDLKGYIRQLNHVGERLLGQRREETEMLPFLRFIHHGSKYKFIHAFQKLLESQEDQDLKMDTVSLNEECSKSVLGKLSYSYDVLRHQPVVIVTLYDISEIEETQRLMQEYLEVAPNPLVVLQDERIHFANWEASQLLQTHPYQIRGQSLEDFFSTRSQGAYLKLFKDSLKSLVPSDSEQSLDHPLYLNDSLGALPVQVKFNSLRAQEDKNLMVVSLRDLSFEFSAREEMLRAKEAAEKANQLKTHFLANVSHEMRTPLAAIQGYSEILQSHQKLPRDDLEQKMLNRILFNCRHLKQIVEDLVDMSKVEAGKTQIKRERFVFLEWLQVLYENLKMAADEKGIELKYEVGERVPALIESDPHRLHQIVSNLINNGIKFTDQGYVFVRVQLQEIADRSQLLIRVEDTGKGISPEFQSQVFDPFQQEDMSTTRKEGGFGLGLSLSKKLAALLGGDLQLEKSKAQQGTIFALTLPLNLEEEVVATPEERPSSDWEERPLPQKILMVEDSEDLRNIFQLMVASQVPTLDFAADGEKALKQLKDHSYEVILMDIQMPVMDGIEATRQIRGWGVKTPIIGLSAHAIADKKEYALSQGLDDFMVKPFQRSELFEKLKYWKGKESTHSSGQ